MSDVLLTEISKKLSDIHAALKGGAAAGAVNRPAGTAGAGAGAGKPGTAVPGKPNAAPGTAKPNAAPGTAKPGATAGAAGKAAGAAPAAGTKGPGGKHTAEEVRAIIKQVATNANLGKQSALAILDENAGVQNVSSVKPENFDAVYEACEVELAGVAGAAADAGDPDDPTA
jgi:hypothetical protein